MWDNVLLDGIVVMYEVGLAILQMIQQELLVLDSPGSIIERTRKLTSEMKYTTKLRENVLLLFFVSLAFLFT